MHSCLGYHELDAGACSRGLHQLLGSALISAQRSRNLKLMLSCPRSLKIKADVTVSFCPHAQAHANFKAAQRELVKERNILVSPSLLWTSGQHLMHKRHACCRGMPQVPDSAGRGHIGAFTPVFSVPSTLSEPPH